MKKYIGTKEVWAEPMTRGEAYDRHLLKDGVKVSECETDKVGYLVQYRDGYQYWCPKKVFEKSYRLTETYLDRLVMEFTDLKDKIRKLKNFRLSAEFDKLPLEERSLLVRQDLVMSEFAYLVCERINMAQAKKAKPDGIRWRDVLKELPEEHEECLVKTTHGVRLCRLTRNSLDEQVWYNENWRSNAKYGEVIKWIYISDLTD